MLTRLRNGRRIHPEVFLSDVAYWEECFDKGRPASIPSSKSRAQTNSPSVWRHSLDGWGHHQGTSRVLRTMFSWYFPAFKVKGLIPFTQHCSVLIRVKTQQGWIAKWKSVLSSDCLFCGCYSGLWCLKFTQNFSQLSVDVRRSWATTISFSLSFSLAERVHSEVTHFRCLEYCKSGRQILSGMLETGGQMNACSKLKGLPCLSVTFAQTAACISPVQLCAHVRHRWAAHEGECHTHAWARARGGADQCPRWGLCHSWPILDESSWIGGPQGPQ